MSAVVPAQADLITGPFIPGTGSWQVVPNGGFELGTIASWTPVVNVPGTWAASSDRPFSGSFAALGESAVTFDVGGFGLAQDVGLVAGQRYVLSGFFYTGEASGGTTYLDLNDIPGDPEPGAAPGAQLVYGIDQWQFAWAEFTASSNLATVRLVRDARLGPVIAGERVYADELAITPADQFAPPQVAAVPEPSGLISGAMGLIGLVGYAGYRRIRSRRASSHPISTR